MPGLIKGLETARRAMLAHQTVLNVTGHNVANVNTPGYSRRSATLVTTPGEPESFGILGSGVRVDEIRRHRDVLLDAQWRHESALSGRYAARADLLGRAAELFSEPSENGIARKLDDFWNGWLEFSNQPEDLSLRVLVSGSASGLAEAIRTQDARIGELVSEEQNSIELQVSEVNQRLSEIAQLNEQIVRSEAGRLGENGDLRDQRDLALDELSRLVGAGHITRQDGTVVVRIGSRTVVDGGRVDSLRAERVTGANGPEMRLLFDSDGADLAEPTGEIGGRWEVVTRSLPELRNRLDQWTRSFITEVNRAHAAGPSGVAFFTGDRASSIELNPILRDDPSQIDAGSSGDPGDNDIALAMAALRDAPVLANGTTTLEEGYRSLVGGLGPQAQQAEQIRLSQESVVAHLEQDRLAASGVNLEEEMTRLIGSQKAFEAAARLFQTASDLIDTLLAL